jgi:hypothetical protein
MLLGWDEVRSQVELIVTAPSPETQDRDKEAQRDATYVSIGSKSPQIVCEEQGYDWARVQKDNADVAKAKQALMPQQPEGGDGGDERDPHFTGITTDKAGHKHQFIDGKRKAIAESKDASGHEHKGKGEGGGQFTGSGGGGDKGHNVALPTKKSKLNIDQASAALKEMGYELGAGRYEPKYKAMLYKLKKPDGSEAWASTDEIKQIVYDGARKKAVQNADKASSEPHSGDMPSKQAKPWETLTDTSVKSMSFEEVQAACNAFEAQFAPKPVPQDASKQERIDAQKAAFAASTTPEAIRERLRITKILAKARNKVASKKGKEKAKKVHEIRMEIDDEYRKQHETGQKLQELGYKREHKSNSGSEYWTATAKDGQTIKVRVSDHDVPETAERSHAASQGGFSINVDANDEDEIAETMADIKKRLGKSQEPT